MELFSDTPLGTSEKLLDMGVWSSREIGTGIGIGVHGINLVCKTRKLNQEVLHLSLHLKLFFKNFSLKRNKVFKKGKIDRRKIQDLTLENPGI